MRSARRVDSTQHFPLSPAPFSLLSPLSLAPTPTFNFSLLSSPQGLTQTPLPPPAPSHPHPIPSRPVLSRPVLRGDLLRRGVAGWVPNSYPIRFPRLQTLLPNDIRNFVDASGQGSRFSCNFDEAGGDDGGGEVKERVDREERGGEGREERCCQGRR